MILYILLFPALTKAKRNITDEEYQTPSKLALMPSFQYNFDKYVFNTVGELEKFLPIDDDTWGEFLIQQPGFKAKFNFLERFNTFFHVYLFIKQLILAYGTSLVLGLFVSVFSSPL